VIDTDKLKKLIDEKALDEFRSHALNPSMPTIRGTAQNEDIYFQATEVRNEYYNKFQEELAKDPAYAFICYIDANYVAKASIQGIAADTVMGHHGVGIFWNVTEWTIDK